MSKANNDRKGKLHTESSRALLKPLGTIIAFHYEIFPLLGYSPLGNAQGQRILRELFQPFYLKYI